MTDPERIREALAVFEDMMRGLPDWIAWRMEAWVVAMRDVQDPRILPWAVLKP